ncbi:MAG: hypothetical protein V1871_05490 [Planctomycetota bacterium]
MKTDNHKFKIIGLPILIVSVSIMFCFFISNYNYATEDKKVEVLTVPPSQFCESYPVACRYVEWIRLKLKGKYDMDKYGRDKLKLLHIVHVVFTEIDTAGSTMNQKEGCYTDFVASIGLRSSVEKFVDKIFNKNDSSPEEIRFLEIFNEEIYRGGPALEYLWPTPMRKSTKEEYQDRIKQAWQKLRTIQNELSNLISDTLVTTIKIDSPNRKLLPLMYLLQAYNYGWLEEYKQAIATYDKIINYDMEGFDDYKLTAMFNKARCVGALSKDYEIQNRYGGLWNFMPYKTWHWYKDKEGNHISNYYYDIAVLSRCKEANAVYEEILKNYKHLSKTRRAIFIWIQEIMAGKPLPELYSSPPIEDANSDKPEQPENKDTNK